jgi:RNA polymerase sigma factor (sigma-70 family)
VNLDLPFDRACLAALQAGDDVTFERLVDQMQAPLFSFAWRYLNNAADAEDVVVEAFVRLHQARRRLRPDTNLSAWLFTTLANLCHNRHRWRRRHPEVSLDAPAPNLDRAPAHAVEHPAGDPRPDETLEHGEAAAALRSAIDRLPHEQRIVVLLHHYEHLGYHEIAGIVGCSERGVETRLYRARQQLRIELAVYLRERTAS